MHLNFSSPHLQVWARLKAAALLVDAEFHSMIEAAEAEAHELFRSGEPYPHLAPGPAVMAPVAAPAPEPFAEQEPVVADPPQAVTTLSVGDTGAFFPSNSKFSIGATVIKVWSATCVNLSTDDGQLPTSVLVRNAHDEASSGYYFVPGAEPVLAPIETQSVQVLSSEPIAIMTTEEVAALSTAEIPAMSSAEIHAQNY